MKRVDSNLDFAALSPQDILMRIRPVLEELLAYIRKMESKQMEAIESSPCNICIDRNTCKIPCEKLKVLLPAVNQGRGMRENLTGLYLYTLTETERIRSHDILSQYEICKEDIRTAQWEAVCLRYGQDLTLKQIGEKLGKAPSTISGLLQRAKVAKEKYFRQRYKRANTK